MRWEEMLEAEKSNPSGFTAYAVPGVADRIMINSGAGIAPGEPDVGRRPLDNVLQK